MESSSEIYKARRSLLMLVLTLKCRRFAKLQLIMPGKISTVWMRVACANRMPGPKVDKTRITITLCFNADGSDKLPPHFIGFSANPRDLTEAQRAHQGITWRGHKTAWMSTVITAEWLVLFYKHVKGRRVLLLMDNLITHKCALKESPQPENVVIRFLPALSTSVYQALDQGIIHHAKTYYVKKLLRATLDWRYGNHMRGKNNRPKLEPTTLTKYQAILWFLDAWHIDVKPETIINCFTKTTLFLSVTELVEEAIATQPAEAFMPPPADPEMVTLYEEYVDVMKISDAMDVLNFVIPENEDTLPPRAMTTIQGLIEAYLPNSDYEKDEEKGNEEQDAQAPVRKPVAWGIFADDIATLAENLEDRGKCELSTIFMLGQLFRKVRDMDVEAEKKNSTKDFMAAVEQNTEPDVAMEHLSEEDLSIEVLSEVDLC